jgi:hypothetical protein
LFHAGKHDEIIAAYLWAKTPEVIKYNSQTWLRGGTAGDTETRSCRTLAEYDISILYKNTEERKMI